jgi:hypothetical protein
MDDTDARSIALNLAAQASPGDSATSILERAHRYYAFLLGITETELRKRMGLPEPAADA